MGYSIAPLIKMQPFWWVHLILVEWNQEIQQVLSPIFKTTRTISIKASGSSLFIIFFGKYICPQLCNTERLYFLILNLPGVQWCNKTVVSRCSGGISVSVIFTNLVVFIIREFPINWFNYFNSFNTVMWRGNGYIHLVENIRNGDGERVVALICYDRTLLMLVLIWGLSIFGLRVMNNWMELSLIVEQQWNS